jgi:hypothetical protein
VKRRVLAAVTAVAVTFVCGDVTGVAVAQKRRAAPRADGGKSASKAGDGGKTTVDPKTGQKSKSYTFGGLDIDGKLKTPQLLYFLNRMKSEFDTTTPDKRSFIPELKRSTDEM